MDNEFDMLDERKRESLSLPNAVNIFLIAAVVIAALLSMGELTLSWSGALNISLLVIFLYLVASLVYRNNYSGGMAKGKLSEEYKRAKTEYDEAVKAINELGLLPCLPELCIRYREEDLRYRRTEVLSDMCIDYDLYEEKYLGKSEEDLRDSEEKLGEDEVKCILKANKLKGIRITRNILLSTGEGGDFAEKLLNVFNLARSVSVESVTRQRIDLGLNMLSRAATTILAGVVGISLMVESFSLQFVAQWAVRMLPILFAAIGGNSAGVKNVLETLVPSLERKTAIMKVLIAWGKEKTSRIIDSSLV